MKKWILGFVIAATVMIGSVWFYDNCYLPEFEIVNIIKVGADNFTSVTLQVQVNRRCYDMDEISEKVRGYYCDLNGEPEVLKIKLSKK